MSQRQDYQRAPARRVFASEFIDGTYTFKESDDDRAPSYQLLPTGQRANRVFIIGTVTEIEDVGDENQYLRARVVDPTGTINVYAGQYQPEAMSSLQDIEPPTYVAVCGKPRTYDPDDDDSIYVSIRPEFISTVSENTRNDWVRDTADQTLDRIENQEASNPDVQLAEEKYGDVDTDTYVDSVITALESLDAEQTESSDSTEQSDASTENDVEA